MLDTNVTLRDLGLLLVFFVIIVAGVFLIRALVHLGGAMRDIKKLISKNVEGMDKVIKDLPALSANAVSLTEYASDVVDNLRNEQEMLESTLESVSDTIESISETARALNEDFLGSLKKLAGSVMSLVRFITKRKPSGGESSASGAGDSAGGSAGAAGSAGLGSSGDGGGGGDAESERVIFGKVSGIDVKSDRRERKKKSPRMRSAAVGARKRQQEKAKSINIHIR